MNTKNMEKNKDNAYSDYIDMIQRSWTWARMSSNEHENCLRAFERAHLKGSYRQRWEYLQDIYTAFLFALDYKDGIWRRTEDEPLF